MSEVRDGGYGWIVCFISFCINFMLDGIAFCFAIFIPDYREAFDASLGNVSVAIALLTGVILLEGPIVAVLVDKFGCRKVSFAGSLITASGFVLSTFSTTVTMFQFTYGFIGGVGYGLMVIPTITAVGQWFDNKRPIAMGVSFCGAGIGIFVLAPIAKLLHSETDWRTAHYTFAAIFLQGCVLAGLMRTHEQTTPETLEEIVDTDEEKLSAEQEESLFSYKHKSKSTGALDVVGRSEMADRLHSSAVVCREKEKSEKEKITPSSLYFGSSWCQVSTQALDISNGSTPTIPKEEGSCWVHRLKKAISCMFESSILKNRDMLLFGAGNFMGSFGYFYLNLYLPAQAINHGISEQEASLLLSVYGASNTAGRVLFGGIVACVPRISSLALHNICVTIAGLSMLLAPFCTSYLSMMLVIASYGLFISTFVSLAPVIICDLVGVDNLSSAFGLMLLERGVAVIVGPPVGGMLFDLTNKYEPIFYSGGAWILAGVVFFLILQVKQYRSVKSDVNADN